MRAIGRVAFLYFRRFPDPTTPIRRVRRFCCCCFCCIILTTHPLKPFQPVVLPSTMRTTTTATTTTTSTRILRKINNAVRFIVVGSRAYFRRTRLAKDRRRRHVSNVAPSTFNIIYFITTCDGCIFFIEILHNIYT